MAAGDKTIKYENWTIIITTKCSEALKDDMMNAIKNRNEK